MARPPKGNFTVQFGIRLDAPLVARLELLEAKLGQDAPWANPTRADALRAAVVAALLASGHQAGFVLQGIGSLKVDDDAFIGTATGATASRLANPASQAAKAESYGIGVNWVLTQNAKLSADYNLTSFEGGGGGSSTNPIDRRDEKAVFTRLTIQY